MSLRVLIVDDEPDILLLLRLALQTAGHDITEASDGRVAIDRLHDGDFDIVLLDAMMPGMDGWAALERMRAMEGTPPVIMLSAKTAEGDRARAFRLGAAAYVTKPFEPAHLLHEIENVSVRDAAPRAAIPIGTRAPNS
jgi:two-component system, OmpR family, alkaline phosphatase synthesis response regulator PhoP